MVPSRISSRLFGHGDGKQRDASQKKRSKFGSYVALTKPRIIELLLVTTIPTMVLAAGKWPSVSLMVITLLGGSLAAGGANAINMYIDRDIDALMVRTQGRPLVTGDIRPQNALMFAVLLEIAAFAVLWSGANLLSALLALSATMFYVCIYSLWLKRTSKQNIVIGGARSGSGPGWLGRSAKLAGLGSSDFVLSHLFLDTATFLGLGNSALRRLSGRRRAHVASRCNNAGNSSLDGHLFGDPDGHFARIDSCRRSWLYIWNYSTVVWNPIYPRVNPIGP